MADSIHDKLKRVRKPRVHITYDLETNGVTEEKEIPFVMGVMGDYSGDNAEAKKALKDRKFANIDSENFNDLMSKVNPQLRMKVENTLEGDGTELGINLNFNSMEDFEPHRLVEQVEPLKQLLATRNKLRDLLTKADRSEDLEKILEDVLSNTEALNNMSSDLGVNAEEEIK